MTNEKAITILEMYKQRLVNSVSIGLEKDIEAYDMAIRALKNEQSQVEKQVKDLDEAGKWFLKGVIEGFNEQTEMDDLIIENMPSAEKTTLSAEKTTINRDLISRDKALELVNYALAENKDVLDVLENMPSETPVIVSDVKFYDDYKAELDIIKQLPSAEKTDSFIPQEDVAGILNTVESALKGTNYEVVGYDNTDGFLKVLIDVK